MRTEQGAEVLAWDGPNRDRLTGHIIPVARDPQVQALSRAASDHARNYVDDVLDPKLVELRQSVAGGGGGRVGEQALADVISLQQLVHTLPAEMAYQIGQAQVVDDVQLRSPLEEKITQLMHVYPWMAPKLVSIRHALSEQALMDNVARPAAEQIGLG